MLELVDAVPVRARSVDPFAEQKPLIGRGQRGDQRDSSVQPATQGEEDKDDQSERDGSREGPVQGADAFDELSHRAAMKKLALNRLSQRHITGKRTRISVDDCRKDAERQDQACLNSQEKVVLGAEDFCSRSNPLRLGARKR